MSQGSTERVTAYYSRFDEWGRLESQPGLLEFERTLDYISAALPSESTILDLGGGPGRYAIALAQLGHTISLVDVSPEQVEQARTRISDAGQSDRVPLVSVGSAEDLSDLESGAYDAVVALGPFYHLIEESSRIRAADEIARVLRPGGLAFIAFIPRASGLAGLIVRAAQDAQQVTADVVRRVAAEGVFVNPTERGFQNAYYPHVEEIQGLFDAAGFREVDLFSIRSLYLGAEEAAATIREHSPETAAQIERVLHPLSRDPNLIALGGHALLVLEK